MPTNERDLQALHYLVKRLRSETMGAGEWHDAGISAVLARMKGHNLALTIERVTRHAADPNAKTPAAMERPFVPEAPIAGPPRPPKPSEACRNCGVHVDRCRCETGPRTRPLPRDPDTSARVAELRTAAAQPTDRPTTTAREGLRGAHRE